MPLSVYVFSFIFGTIVGSFLNVVIERIDTKESIFFSRSHCPSCKKILQWWELIPILSFIILKGRCSSCKQKISLQYPLVEFLTGLVFLFLSWRIFRFPFSKSIIFFSDLSILKIIAFLNFIFLFYWMSVLIVISIYDIKKFLILDEVLFPAIFISLFWRLLFYLATYFDKNFLSFNHFLGNFEYTFGYYSYFLSLFLGVLFPVLTISIIVYLSKEKAMGWGDAILAFFIGLILGFPESLIALIIAFLTGGFSSLIFIIFKKKNLKSYLPFAPFLSLGALLVMLFGDIIIKGYFSLI